jgi:vancomycin resistance protein VanW
MATRESEVGAAARTLRAVRRRAREASRLARWIVEPRAFPPPEIAPPGGPFRHRVYEARIRIARAAADPVLEAGKRANVALAAPAFDGVVLAPSRPLSFWRALGRPAEEAGFRAGVEILGGCLVPSIGGGLCLLSNALFAMAARLGWTILERHGHSAEVALRASGEPWGLDATVLWPHLDLRIAPRAGRARLAMTVRDDHVELAVDTTEAPAVTVALSSESERTWIDRGERVRGNLIVRVTSDLEGRVLRREVVAWNRKRVADVRAHRRTCLTCDEAGCRTGLVALRRVR